MNKFEITLRTVTPTFCRGRDEREAEIRAPSLKGLLRWWYRAWQPLAVNGPSDGPWAEGKIMGGTHAHSGQCPFTLRIEIEPFTRLPWTQVETSAPRNSRSQVGGTRYLGFAFRPTRDDPKDHRAVPAGTSFRAIHTFPRPHNAPGERARALVAAWWLLVHLGGLGARSRRGFGSLAIESWSWPDRADLLGELPLPAQARDGNAWQASMLSGLRTLDGWLGPKPRWPRDWPHPHLGPGAEVVLDVDAGWKRYTDALEMAGRTLALLRREHRGRGPVDGRVTVGLPLETGRRPVRSWRPGSFQGHRIETDRHASALHLSIGAYRGGFGVCWTRLAGPVPGLGAYRVREENSRRTLRDEAPDTLGALVQSLEGGRWTPGGAQ